MPTTEHIFFIPGVLIVGIMLGFWIGVRVARNELERREKERRE